MDINLENYYERAQAEVSHKDYKYLIFRAGDKLQSAEMNDLQLTLEKQLSDVSLGFVENGSRISGIDINIERNDTGSTDGEGRKIYDLTITNTEGVFFLDGKFIRVLEGSFTVPNQVLETSNFRIGINVETRIVSYKEDPSLVDPGLETRNQGQPGANRYEMVGYVGFLGDVIDEEDRKKAQLHVIKGGDIYVKRGQSYLEIVEGKIVDVVAKYDHNSNGNYLKFGYETSFRGYEDPVTGDMSSNLGPFFFDVAIGSANIGGYNFESDESKIVGSYPLVDFELHQAEPFIGNGDGFYPLRHSPIRKVFRISGVKEMLDYGVTHEYAGSDDSLAPYTLNSVSRVYQGSTEYVRGTDWDMLGDKIEWKSTASNEPSPGSTYYVDFKYRHVETQSNFSEDPNDNTKRMGDLSDDMKSIYIHGFATGEIVQIDYDFILRRRDIILLNSEGKLFTIRGVAKEDNPKAPQYDEISALKIADIILSGDQDPGVMLDSNRTFKMSDIQLILDSTKDQAYNVNRLALELNLAKKQPGARFRGQFVDDFNDDRKRDMGLPNDAITMAGSLILDMDWKTVFPVSSPTAEGSAVNLYIDGQIAQNPIISQPYYTQSRKIQDYLFQAPPPVELKVSPKVHKWIDRTSFIKKQRVVQANTAYTYRYGYYWWYWYYGYSRTRYQSLGTTKRTDVKYNDIDEPVVIPDIPLTLTAPSASMNQSEDYDIFVDAVKLETAQSDEDGGINKVIHLPEGTLSGSKEIVIAGKDSQAMGITKFLAIPQEKEVTETTTTTWRWVVTRYRYVYWWYYYYYYYWYYPYYYWYYYRWYYRCPYYYDPLAQTFTPERTFSLGKVDFVFEDKSLTDVECRILETKNGYPNSKKILARTTVTVDNLVEVGEIQSFVFDDKISLEAGTEYAVQLVNNDATASVRSAELGKWEKSEGKWLTDNSYGVGAVFSSANNSAWTVHQKEDLQFWLYEANFDNSKVYTYDFNVTDATDLTLSGDNVVRPNTEVSYRITLSDLPIDGSLPRMFENVQLDDIVVLGDSYSGEVKVEVTLRSEDGVFSPQISEDLQLGVGTISDSAVYSSLGFEIDSSDVELVAYVDTMIPNGTSFSIEAQIVNPTTKVQEWIPLTETSESEALGDNWYEKKYVLDLVDDGTSIVDVDQTLTRIRINLGSTASVLRPAVGNLRVSVNQI